MGEIEMAAAAAQTKPPRIVFPSIITAITTPSSHSSSPSHWCPALEFMLLCDWVLWRSVGRAEIIYIPGSVFCRPIQCIESKGIRTDANVYHNLINQQSTRHIASVSVIERDVTKHRRVNIIIWIKNDTNNDKKATINSRRGNDTYNDKKATINSRRRDHQCFQTQWIQQLTRLGFIREFGVDLLDKNTNIKINK